MDVNRTIAGMIHTFPSLFKNRTQALHHLFCVNGNGFEWENGELVDFYTDEQRAEYAADVVTYLDGSPRSEYEYARLQTVQMNAEVLARVNGPGLHLYPYCEYAKIVNLPDDVTLDWALSALEHAWEIYDDRSNLTLREEWVKVLTAKGLLMDEHMGGT